MKQISEEWKEYHIEDLGSVVTGHTPPRKNKEYFEISGYIWIKPTDIQKGARYVLETEEYYSQKSFEKYKRSLIPPLSTCVVTIGTVGEKMCLTHEQCFTNQAINAVIPDCERFDPFFVYYLLKNNLDSVLQLNSGTASGRENISKSNFSSLIVKAPSKQTQIKISTILSCYDNLIENNTRRIKILENIVKAIYHEWFVNFHFPEYDNAQMVESELGLVPEGWVVSKLGDCLSAIESGARPVGGAKGYEKGIPSVGAENVKGIAKHDFYIEKFVPKGFFKLMRKGVVKNRDIALYKDGAYIGRSTYFRDGFPHNEFSVNEHVFLLRSNEIQLTQNFLYLWLQESDTVTTIRATNVNAAQPGINQESVKNLKLILPSEKILRGFDDLVEPLLAQIVHLAKSDRIIHRTRDLLLPKLMSGEIDASEINIKIPEAEA